MLETKPCEVCGSVIVKPASCSKADWPKRRFCSRACKAESQRGKDAWNKGLEMPKTAPRHPCRICGQPTKYRASLTSITGMVHCDQPECVEASRRLKNERIAARAVEMYATGKRPKVRHAWDNVSRISREETMIAPWFTSQGWVAQHRVKTGASGNLPKQFDLDFALPDRKLFVEIDGSVHRLRKERDARRDAMLAELGWTGLRLPSDLVASDVDAAVHRITSWLSELVS